MDKEIREAFEERISQTDEVEKQVEEVGDQKEMDSVVKGRKEIHLIGFPRLVFYYPNVGLSLEADEIMAEFRTKALRHGQYLTREQLKAIYGRPTTINVDGKEVVVGEGQWLNKDEDILEDYNKLIDGYERDFLAYREELQTKRNELLANEKNSKKKKELEKEIDKLEVGAFGMFKKTWEMRKELLETQLKQMELFAPCLEERSFVEKIKFLAPKCIKTIKDNGEEEFLWKSSEEFRNANFDSTKVISLFRLFLQGGDVSFFEDVPDIQ